MQHRSEPGSTPVLGAGRYTVVLASGAKVNLGVTTAGPRFRAGRLLVARLGDPDSVGDADQPFAHIDAHGRARLWRRFADDATLGQALARLVVDPAGAAVAYGRRGLRCARCRRPLTHPDSVERGMGSHCARQLARAAALADVATSASAPALENV